MPLGEGSCHARRQPGPHKGPGAGVRRCHAADCSRRRGADSRFWQQAVLAVCGELCERNPARRDQGEVVVAIRLPSIKAGDRFWSFKVRHHCILTVSTLGCTPFISTYVTVECCQMGVNSSSWHGFRLVKCCHRHSRFLGGRRCLTPLTCYPQIAERHWNAHAFINIAALLNIDSNCGQGGRRSHQECQCCPRLPLNA